MTPRQSLAIRFPLLDPVIMPAVLRQVEELNRFESMVSILAVDN